MCPDLAHSSYFTNGYSGYYFYSLDFWCLLTFRSCYCVFKNSYDHILSLFLSELILMKQIRWFQGTHIRTVLSSKSESLALGMEQCSLFHWIQIPLPSEPAWVRTHGQLKKDASEEWVMVVEKQMLCWPHISSVPRNYFSSYCIIKAKY